MFFKQRPPNGEAVAHVMEGPELMLRSLGLGRVLDAANALADGGTIEKIVAFADALPTLMGRLERIEQALYGGKTNGEAVARFIERRYDADYGPELEPGSGSGDSGLDDVGTASRSSATIQSAGTGRRSRTRRVADAEHGGSPDATGTTGTLES